MDKEKIGYGDIVFFENGERILIGPPSGEHNDWSMKYSVIPIEDDETNCRLFYEFRTLEDALSYKENGEIVKVININSIR